MKKLLSVMVSLVAVGFFSCKSRDANSASNVEAAPGQKNTEPTVIEDFVVSGLVPYLKEKEFLKLEGDNLLRNQMMSSVIVCINREDSRYRGFYTSVKTAGGFIFTGKYLRDEMLARSVYQAINNKLHLSEHETEAYTVHFFECRQDSHCKIGVVKGIDISSAFRGKGVDSIKSCELIPD